MTKSQNQDVIIPLGLGLAWGRSFHSDWALLDAADRAAEDYDEDMWDNAVARSVSDPVYQKLTEEFDTLWDRVKVIQRLVEEWEGGTLAGQGLLDVAVQDGRRVGYVRLGEATVRAVEKADGQWEAVEVEHDELRQALIAECSKAQDYLRDEVLKLTSTR